MNLNPPPSKRERLTTVLHRLGITALLENFQGRPGLFVLNYHRIGCPQQYVYDTGLFEAEPTQFDEQVRFLKSRFHVAELAEVRQWAERKTPLRRLHVLLTFDDGYHDSYEVVYPTLKSHGVQGTFFLPTAYIGSDLLPWWDQIAFLVRHSRRPEIVLDFPRPYRLDLRQVCPATAVRLLQNVFKDPAMTDPGRFLAGLAASCDLEPPRKAEHRLFLNWEEAAEMVRGGMAIGSHTHTHPILSKLAAEAQYSELSQSRTILSEKLPVPPDAIAYPVGGRTSFNVSTLEMAVKAGYALGFSYYGGLNLPHRIHPYNLLRFSVERGVSFERFRFRAATVATFGRRFF